MDKAEIKRILAKLEVRPSKGKGQNFLFDSSSIEQIIEFARVTEQDEVLEIGPGLGVLSSQLVELSRSYSFVEIETKFRSYLLKQLNLDEEQAIEQDIRKVKLEGEKKLVVSNVPYSISSEVILWCVENHKYISRACLLLQREFAERIASEPGERSCGSLSVLRALYGKCRLGAVVSGDNFLPPAKIESRLLEIEFYSEPLFPGIEQEKFEKVVRASFSHRRKTVINSLVNSGVFGFEKSQWKEVLEKAGIDSGSRAENIKLEGYVEMVRAVVA